MLKNSAFPYCKPADATSGRYACHDFDQCSFATTIMPYHRYGIPLLNAKIKGGYYGSSIISLRNMIQFDLYISHCVSFPKYESILIKFSPDFVKPFIDTVGENIFDEIYRKKVFSFSRENQHKISHMFYEMEYEYAKATPYKEFILQGMLFRLLASVWELHLPDVSVDKTPSPITEPVMLAIQYIEENYDKNPSLEEVSHVANLSAGHLSKLFLSQLGMSYTEYFNNIRIRHVEILLTQTSKTIMEIAMETGYCNGDYLSAQFKKLTGMSPTAFRKLSANTFPTK